MNIHKNAKKKIFALLLSIILLFSVTVQSTFCYIITETNKIRNTFKSPNCTNSTLIISKTVEHPFGEAYIIPDGIEFDFKVDLGPRFSGYTFKTTKGDITANKNGVLYLSIKANDYASIEGIDDGVKVTVTELQNKSGFMVSGGADIKEITLSKEKINTINFTNIYVPRKVSLKSLSVMGEKTLEGRNWQENDEFSFLFEYDNGIGEWTALETKTVRYDKTNKEFNKFDFNDAIKSIEFTKAGTYSFRVSELEGDIKGVVYDKTVKSFSVTIGDADMDGKLEIWDVCGLKNVKVTKSGKNYNVDVSFNNFFKEQEETPPPEEDNATPDTGDELNLSIVIALLIVGISMLLTGKRRKA